MSSSSSSSSSTSRSHSVASLSLILIATSKLFLCAASHRSSFTSIVSSLNFSAIALLFWHIMGLNVGTLSRLLLGFLCFESGSSLRDL